MFGQLPQIWHLPTRKVSAPTRQKHIVWWIVVAISRAGNLPRAVHFRFGIPSAHALVAWAIDGALKGGWGMRLSFVHHIRSPITVV
jgi:hypothetical protein